jgi:hypothetical protein
LAQRSFLGETTMTRNIIVIAILSIVLVACDKAPTSSKKIGEIEGCELFEIGMGGFNQSIILAKCKDGSNASTNRKTTGKNPVTLTTVTVMLK